MIFSPTLILNDIAIATQTSPKLLSRIAATAFESIRKASYPDSEPGVMA
jgi:hypothetical protein